MLTHARRCSYKAISICRLYNGCSEGIFILVERTCCCAIIRAGLQSKECNSSTGTIGILSISKDDVNPNSAFTYGLLEIISIC